MQTHEVFNQSLPLYGHNVADDPTLLEGLVREDAEWAVKDVSRLGMLAGTEHVQQLGRLANENPPILRPYDRFGNRIDDLEFHPAWHELMSTAVANGMHGSAWANARSGSHVAPCRQVLRVEQRRGRPHLPDLGDLRRGALAAGSPRTGCDLRTTAVQFVVRGVA